MLHYSSLFFLKRLVPGLQGTFKCVMPKNSRLNILVVSPDKNFSTWFLKISFIEIKNKKILKWFQQNNLFSSICNYNCVTDKHFKNIQTQFSIRLESTMGGRKNKNKQKSQIKEKDQTGDQPTEGASSHAHGTSSKPSSSDDSLACSPDQTQDLLRARSDVGSGTSTTSWDTKDSRFRDDASKGKRANESTQVMKKSYSESANSCGKYKTTSFNEDWLAIKALSLNDKRKMYTCRSYFTLERILSWPEYYKEKNLCRISKRQLPVSIHANPMLNGKISLFIGDITSLEIDCIVNAANSSLLGGGGVDGAIHRAAGPSLLKECRTLQGCSTGDAKITYGYKLPATHVIHTVGPMNGDAKQLFSCYQTSLEIARKFGLRSIAFPCVSTGIYGFPNDRAAEIVLSLTKSYLEEFGDHFDRIIFCLFMQEDIYLYQDFMQVFFPIQSMNQIQQSSNQIDMPLSGGDQAATGAFPAHEGSTYHGGASTGERTLASLQDAPGAALPRGSHDNYDARQQDRKSMNKSEERKEPIPEFSEKPTQSGNHNKSGSKSKK